MKLKLTIFVFMMAITTVSLRAETRGEEGHDGEAETSDARQEVEPVQLTPKNINAKNQCFVGRPSDGGAEGGGPVPKDPGSNVNNPVGNGDFASAPVFSSCKECHGKTQPAITSLSAAQAKVASGAMPPKGSTALTEAEKSAIANFVGK